MNPQSTKISALLGLASVLVLAAAIFYVRNENLKLEAQKIDATKTAEAAKITAEKTGLENASEQVKKRTAELAIEKASLQQSSDDAKQQANELKNAVEASKANQQQLMDRAKHSRALSEGLAMAQQLKVAIAEYYQSELKWPKDNQAIGLPAAESYRSENVRSIGIEAYDKTARIRIKYAIGGGTAQSLAQQLFLVAAVNDAGQISWRCVSTDIKDIGEIITSCRYQAM